MNGIAHVPPGFRFHPTDEELVDYYLRKKVMNRRIDVNIIKDIDLYRIEPWDLRELCKIGTEEENEWYFFSHKDKKYPTGSRTNRATGAGFWKATGRDKAIYLKHELIGLRKTLVFYKGRAPNGEKSDWIMHEYRLESDQNQTPQEEGWVICRVFEKRITMIRTMSEHNVHHRWYNAHHPYVENNELFLRYQPPPLASQEFLQTSTHNMNHDNPITPLHAPSSTMVLTQEERITHNEEHVVDQVVDWRCIENFVASQLSQRDSRKDIIISAVNDNDIFRSPDEIKFSDIEQLK